MTNQTVTSSVVPLSEIERKKWSKFVIGKATCPWCAQDDIKVVNDKGGEGTPKMHYFENHKIKNTTKPCIGSEKFLVDLGTITVKKSDS